MTVKQHKSDILFRVYAAVVGYWTENQLPPSIRDITKRLNYVSQSNMLGYVLELDKLGYLKVERKKFRSILVVGSKWTPPSPDVVMAIARKENQSRSVLL